MPHTNHFGLYKGWQRWYVRVAMAVGLLIGAVLEMGSKEEYPW